MGAGADAQPHFTQPGQEGPQEQHTEVPRHTQSPQPFSQQQLKFHPPCTEGTSSTEATRFQVFRGISSSITQQPGDRATSSQPC